MVPSAPPTSRDPIPYQYIITTFLLLSSIKYLLVPTYRSTDFDVHRNWLAITHHLPLQQWYFDNVNGTTVHTLDYPPLFAFFEWGLSNNIVTRSLLENGWLDGRCLELLPDDSMEGGPSDRCVRFHRATVIASDVVLFLGAYLVSFGNLSYYSSTTSNIDRGHSSSSSSWFTFLLIVTNPGLILLDHVHFQYNGMLLGILLCSVSFIIRGSQTMNIIRQTHKEKGAGGATAEEIMCTSSRWWELAGASTFAALLAMKHLYLTLAPLYLFYLLRHHCFIAEITSPPSTSAAAKGEEKREMVSVKSTSHANPNITFRFSLERFTSLAIVALVCFLGPFVPFIIQPDPMGQMNQILMRLFPFGRGLVHDYWAANIWALYLFTSRVASFLFRKAPIPTGLRHLVESLSLLPFPEPPPSIVALCLLIGLIPAMVCAWKVGGASLTNSLIGSRLLGKNVRFIIIDPSNQNTAKPAEFFVLAIAFSSFSGFMLGYHVHEKAIMTAIIPLSLLAATSREHARLFIRTCLLGFFALLPLIFRPEELMFKVTLYIMWLSGAICGLELIMFKDRNDCIKRNEGVLTNLDWVVISILVCLVIFMEVIHPIKFMPSGQLEFLPLMMTSVICAIGLFHCWITSYIKMRQNC